MLLNNQYTRHPWHRFPFNVSFVFRVPTRKHVRQMNREGAWLSKQPIAMRDSRRARENRQKIGIPQVHKSTTKDIYSLFFFKSSENRSTSWPFLGQELFAFLHYCLRVDVLIQLKLPPSCFGLGQGSFKMSTRKLFMRACLLTFFPNDSQNMTSNAVCTNAV